MRKTYQRIITEIFKKKIMWGFNILYSFDLSRSACCMMISQNNDYKFDCFNINTKKNQCLNDTQIKIRFYDLFHHLHMLLRCDSVCDWLNAGRLMTSRHRWLIVELKSDEQFFFHEKSCMMNLNIWLFNNKKTRFSKKTFEKFCINWNMINKMKKLPQMFFKI